MNSNDFILFYEQYALSLLAKHLNVSEEEIQHLTATNQSFPYDLYCLGESYNVKMANPSRVNHRTNALIWDFDLRLNGYSNGENIKYKKNCQCNYWILMGFSGGIPKSIYLIPSEKVSVRHIRIPTSGVSIYKKYLLK